MSKITAEELERIKKRCKAAGILEGEEIYDHYRIDVSMLISALEEARAEIERLKQEPNAIYIATVKAAGAAYRAEIDRLKARVAELEAEASFARASICRLKKIK